MTKIHISTGFVKDLLAPRVNLQDVRGGTVFTQGSGRLLHTSSVSSRYATSSVHWGALSFLTLFLHLLCIWEIKKRQASVRRHLQFRCCCSIPVFSSVLTTADKYCMSSFVAIRRWCFCLRLQLVRHTLDCVTFFSFRLCWVFFFWTFFCQTLLMQYIIKVDTGAKDWLFRGWDRKVGLSALWLEDNHSQSERLPLQELEVWICLSFFPLAIDLVMSCLLHQMFYQLPATVDQCLAVTADVTVHRFLSSLSAPVHRMTEWPEARIYIYRNQMCTDRYWMCSDGGHY